MLNSQAVKDRVLTWHRRQSESLVHLCDQDPVANRNVRPKLSMDKPHYRKLEKLRSRLSGVINKAGDTGFLLARVLVLLLAAGLVPQVAQPQVSQSQTTQTAGRNEPLKAEDIMARVAANQNRSEELRRDYVYKQHIHISTHKGRMLREERADYDVVPQPSGVEKHLRSISGRYWKKNRYVEFQSNAESENDRIDKDMSGNLRNSESIGSPDADLIRYLRNFEPTSSTDEDLIRYLRTYLLDDTSRDGLESSLFPLTVEQQDEYEFRLVGEEVEAGRNVYRIAFSPKHEQELTWTGEAFIDAAEFQPVRVFTKMSGHVPRLVRTMWFDLPGLGFNVAYRRQADGVWFPWTFGAEFRMHTGALFYFNRDVAISVQNSDFAHSSSSASQQPNAADLRSFRK